MAPIASPSPRHPALPAVAILQAAELPIQRSCRWGYRTVLTRAANRMASNMFWLSELMEGRDPTSQPEVTRRVVGHRSPGSGEECHVLLGEPHSMPGDEAGTEHVDLVEMPDDGRSPPAERVHSLHLRFGDVRLDRHGVLAGEP